jgi:flavin-dependent dehydrogenase
MIDLLVVGGGPAGLATALFAARAGLSTAVVEQRPTPVDKACGEGLMPGAVRALDGLGVRPSGRPFRGIRYVDGRRSAEAIFGDGSGLGVRRTVLHRALHDQVLAAGVPIHECRSSDIEQDGDSVTVAGLTARYLAAADGLHSPIRRQLRLGIDDAGPRRFGLRRHFAVVPWSDLVEVHWSANTEAYVTPVGDNLVGVAILGSERSGFADQLAHFPALSERLPVEAATETRGAGPLRQRVRRRVAGRVLLVGDAAGYVDALTGEGIAVSLACASALVDSVARNRPAEYERAWIRATRRYRWITESLLWTRRRRLLAPAIVPAAAALPRVFRALVGQLAG